mgnify:CR=1 FL=1
MRIESSALNMQGGSSVVSMMSMRESLNIWTGQGSAGIRSSSLDVQEFSQQGISVDTSVTSSVAETSVTGEEDPVLTEQELRIQLLEAFLRRITGKDIKFRIPKIKQLSYGYNSSGQVLGNLRMVSFANGLQSSAGFGLVYNRSETHIERSRVSFAAEGIVKTADGREISLNLNFNIDQEVIRQSNFQLKAGDALIEVVNTWHYGKNSGDTPVEIIVFYAGTADAPVTHLKH